VPRKAVYDAPNHGTARRERPLEAQGQALIRPMKTAAGMFAMVDKETVWHAATRCHELLRDAGIAHALVGGVAVATHGYLRTTVDVDWLVRREDQSRVREVLEGAGLTWIAETAEFRTDAGVDVQFLLEGERAGRGAAFSLPDPAAEGVCVLREGLPVIALSKLIEMKIAAGEGDVRRFHKDLADVVELIAANHLNKAFAGRLHKSVRATFRRLVGHARAEG
jgi:hypothetical protein